MGTLSKDIKELNALSDVASTAGLRDYYMREAGMLIRLRDQHPHLDHPATPFVEEMVRLLETMTLRAHIAVCQPHAGEIPHSSECNETQALLQKIKEAE